MNFDQLLTGIMQKFAAMHSDTKAANYLAGTACDCFCREFPPNERLATNPFPKIGVKRLLQALPAAGSTPCLEDRRPLTGSSLFLDVTAEERAAAMQ